MLESISWFLGCSNMAASLVFQAIAFHSPKLDGKMKDSMLRACNVHQVASLGFILLALNKSPESYWNTMNFSILSVATTLFPGVIYYQNLAKAGQKVALSRFVPTGGVLHMVFWVMMSVNYSSYIAKK